MYQNMTREEMIQRLYEGNFTTGELERQLIAKLFEQCCGGGSGSSGGVLVVHASMDIEADTNTFDKTAVEISEALKTMPVIIVNNHVDESDNYWYQSYITQATIKGGGVGAKYVFKDSMEVTYYAVNDNDYPTNQDPTNPK